MTDRLNAAFAVLSDLEEGAPERVKANLDAFHPDAAEVVLGFAFTDVLSRDGLDLRTREMLTVGMLAAIGTAPGQLEFHMRAALNTGVSREELSEIVLQVAVYAGVPACMNAISAARKAFEA
ncbi:carboxymuconolactone decarboxylase [Sulfitobacter alexandrii]|uniref:Carboxymuconolactone decarboxylase n=1 Tax=Sulfitobacter alexandrii TaxID=1917485 RepID=A0A1J0WGJ7_9RHOB|nr:carboxymuconolactone decarboxylase family protein [Sulfitobacter alexandrii]APE43254.1 carboxymuconolactone decarboxylase [Sulfitobacter alexandrii]